MIFGLRKQILQNKQLIDIINFVKPSRCRHSIIITRDIQEQVFEDRVEIKVVFKGFFQVYFAAKSSEVFNSGGEDYWLGFDDDWVVGRGSEAS